MRLVHLTSSTFFGGPERQMLGLARAMPDHIRTTFFSFHEGGRHAAFLNEVRSHGFPAFALTTDFPRIISAIRELVSLLRATVCDVLICHGYKAHILGRIAARCVGIPAVAVSRGWTGESQRVKIYEWLDRRHLRFMDHVVCVSDGQAAKVSRWCGVSPLRLTVIRNSARLSAFENRDPTARHRLLSFFQPDSGVSQVVLAAGRLSPEKGFGVLVEATASMCRENPRAGVVLFGEGVLRPDLERRIAGLGLTQRFLMPGFRTDLDTLIGPAEVVVLPSFTEGFAQRRSGGQRCRCPGCRHSSGWHARGYSRWRIGISRATGATRPHRCESWGTVTKCRSPGTIRGSRSRADANSLYI